MHCCATTPSIYRRECEYGKAFGRKKNKLKIKHEVGAFHAKKFVCAKNEDMKAVRPSLTGIGLLLGIRVVFPLHIRENSRENKKTFPPRSKVKYESYFVQQKRKKQNIGII